MYERVLFFAVLFVIAIILISITVVLYLILCKETLINNYDFYIFSIFWTPSTCSTKNWNNYECFQRIKELEDEKYFTLHGLWPSRLYINKTEYCNSGQTIIPDFSEDEEFHEKLKKYWPGLYSNNTYLWTNEYNKHGYCFIKRNHYNVKDDYKIYFNKSVEMFKEYRDLMEKMLPDSLGAYNVSKTKFKKIFEQKSKVNESTYYIKCEYNRNDPEKKLYLSEIRMYYDLNFNRKKLEKVKDECPDFFLLNFTDESKIPVHQKYDCYVFSMFYGPTSCKVGKQECYNILKTKENNKFAIHGLWPSYKSGIFPQDCNIGEDIEIKQNESAYFNNLQKYWYSTYNNNTYFWTHEYNVHGLCYTRYLKENDNNYEFYFNKSVEIYVKYKFADIFDYVYKDFLHREQIMNRTYLFSKLREKYKDDSFFLYCNNYEGKIYLEDLKFKLDMNYELTSEGKVIDNCPEEFYLEIIDEPLSKEETNDDIWKTYDIYLLSIFWQTTTCKKIGYHCYNVMPAFPKNAWTLQGLWPTYKNGSVPGWCHGDNDIEVERKNNTLYNYMNTYWQSVYSSNERFWTHEYNRHGYCYNKKLELDAYDYDQYFMKAVELYKKYDLANIFINMFKNRAIKGDIKINRIEIENYFETIGIHKDEYLLRCNDILIDGKNISYIVEIRLIFDLDFNLYKNETHITEKDCHFEFMAEFLE